MLPKKMKNFTCSVLGVFLLGGCTLFENPVPKGPSRSDTMGKSVLRPGEEPPPSDTSAHLYLCALEYPDGYDWIKDTAHTSVEARLMLFKDGVCTQSFPTGDRHGVSTDPDTHFILDGDLYTTFSDGTRTYVKRNGEDLLRLDAAEDIVGICLKDGGLWTLGQNRRGEGFVLRLDGSPVIDNRQGVLVGTLYEDEGDLCFAYGTSVQSGSLTLRKYYLSAGGKPREVSVPYDAMAVFDVRRVAGTTYATYRQSIAPNDVTLSTDGGSRILLPTSSSKREPGWGEIIPADGSILVGGWISFSSGVTYFNLWGPEKAITIYNTNIIIYSFYHGDGKTYAIGLSKLQSVSSIFVPPNASTKIDLDKRYRFVSRKAATVYNGRFYAALSGEHEVLLWMDGEKKTLAINGPVTVVAYQ